MPETINLRVAGASDSGQLLAWRNAPEVRAASVNTGEINATEHNKWFKKALKNPDITTYIGVLADQDIGMVRLNTEDDCARISILLDGRFRGRGLSKKLLLAVLEAAPGEVPYFVAEVRRENAFSLALFRSAGFTEVEGGDIHRFKIHRKDMK